MERAFSGSATKPSLAYPHLVNGVDGHVVAHGRKVWLEGTRNSTDHDEVVIMPLDAIEQMLEAGYASAQESHYYE